MINFNSILAVGMNSLKWLLFWQCWRSTDILLTQSLLTSCVIASVGSATIFYLAVAANSQSLADHSNSQPAVRILKLSRWSGDVIRRTGMKNFNAVSHNFPIQHRSRGRGEVRARQVYLNVHSVTGNEVDTEWSVEFWRWKCCREFGNTEHLRPRAVVGYGVNFFLHSPPNCVTRSPGCENYSRSRSLRHRIWVINLWEMKEMICSLFIR